MDDAIPPQTPADGADPLDLVVAALAALQPRQHATAREWLLDQLTAARAAGQVLPISTLRERARADGWPWHSVRRARAALVGEVVTVMAAVEVWRIPLARER